MAIYLLKKCKQYIFSVLVHFSLHKFIQNTSMILNSTDWKSIWKEQGIYDLFFFTFRKRKRRDEKHRRLPTNSQNSSLAKNSQYGNGLDARMELPADPRLPKVGSNGLWMGTPSMYPPGKSYYHDNQRRPQNMQRAISDDRLSPRKFTNRAFLGQVFHVHVPVRALCICV